MESGKPPHRFPSRPLSLPKAFVRRGPRGRHPFRCGPAGRLLRLPGRSAPCREAFKAVPNGPYHKE